jgi:uncharacterized delta-60 repeat protein
VFSVGRLNPNGTLDTSFGGTGIVITTFGSPLGSRAFGVALQPDGKVVAAGTLGGGNSTSSYAVARYNTDGSLDSTFGAGGTVQTTLNGLYDGATDILIQNGKVVLAGMTGRVSGSATVYDVGLMRLNADGSRDATFGDSGKVVGIAGGFSAPVRMALQGDGRLVAVGTTGTSHGSSFGKVFRFSPDGVLENSTNSAWSSSAAENVAVDPAGGIYLAYTYGSTGASGYVDKYNSTGTTVTAQASVTVADNDPFTAAADAYTLTQDTTLTVPAPGVRANDTVSTSNNPQAVLTNYPGSGVVGALHGTVVLNADGSFTYTPNAGYSGTDSFYYKLADGGASSPAAAVTLTVQRTGNALPVSANDSYTTNEDTALTGVLSPEAAAGNSLSMTSDAGDWVGQGKAWGYGRAPRTACRPPPTPSSSASRPVPTGGVSTSRCRPPGSSPA